MKTFLRLALVALCVWIGAALAPTAAQATCGTGVGTCYGIATGNWSTSGTWSATSGGVSCACTPASGDNLIFDANSNGKTFTETATITIGNLDASACTCTIVVNNSQNLTINGNTFSLGSGLTLTISLPANTTWTFASTTGTTTITINMQVLPNMTFNGVGGDFVPAGTAWTLGSSSQPATLTLTNGAFDNSVNNLSATVWGSVSASNSNVRTFNCGSGTWTMAGINGFGFATFTNLTANCSNATIAYTNTLSGAGLTRNFNAGNVNFGALSISAVSVASPNVVNFGVSFGAAVTIGTLSIGSGNVVLFTSGQTLTLTNAPVWSGTQSFPIGLFSSNATSNGQPTIAVTGAPSITWAVMMGIKFTGATAIATNTIDFGNNSGVTITAPSFGGGHIIGGWLMERDLHPGAANDNARPAFAEAEAA